MRSARSVCSALAFALVIIAACSDSSSGTGTKPSGDGGAGDPAATDGSTSGEGQTGPSFCSTLDPQPFLCVDFDDAPNPADIFTSTDGVTVEENGLRAQSDGTSDAWIEHEADPSPQWNVVELGFSLRVVDQAADARTIVARIGQHMTDNECRVELELQPSSLILKGGAGDTKLTKTIAKDKPARVVLSMEAGADGGKVKGNVTIDGQPALAAPVELACSSFPGPPRVTLGRITGLGASDLRFDDIVFDGR